MEQDAKCAAVLNNQYILLRHGPSEANLQGKIVSSPDVGIQKFGLTDAGASIVNATTSAMHDRIGDVAPKVLLFASDFKRTMETANLVCEAFRCAPPVPTPALRERYFGEFDLGDDTNYRRAWAEDRVRVSSHTTFGVESLESVRNRAWSFVIELEQQHRDETIVLVAHGDVLQILQTAFLGIDPRVHRSLRPIAPAEWREMHPVRPGNATPCELIRLLDIKPG